MCFQVKIYINFELFFNNKMFFFNPRFLRKLNWFKSLDKKCYIIWSDTGSHFRCSQLYFYLFNDLAKERIMVNFNLFGEQHGIF